MKIYDISQEIFSCKVYPGDPSPKKEVLSSMDDGALYNLTAFSMCAHNGTHIDAPSHFINDGKTVKEIPLYKTTGKAYVTTFDGVLDEKDAAGILNKAEERDPEYGKRILLKGNATVSENAARVFADKGIYLIGNESQTVGPEDAPMKVHLILLEKEVVLLEGIRLENVPEGEYLLSAQPINTGESDGAPCRAILIKEEKRT